MEIYQVDAFCSELFTGNPAAVCPLDSWLDDQTLQNIAAENNLAETAFFVRENDHFHIRWFTPAVEVDLCGHATLAAAHVLFAHLGFEGDKIVFSSRSGELNVERKGEFLTLDFPADVLTSIPIKEEMADWFSSKPLELYRGKTDYMFVFSNEADIKNMVANFTAIAKATEVRGVIVTAKGNDVDFVSRFFAPQSGISEDPATGSAHTSLTPYWSARLKKQTLTALQLSSRMGYFECKNAGSRIEISGKAKTFFAGQMFVDQS